MYNPLTLADAAVAAIRPVMEQNGGTLPSSFYEPQFFRRAVDALIPIFGDYTVATAYLAQQNIRAAMHHFCDARETDKDTGQSQWEILHYVSGVLEGFCASARATCPADVSARSRFMQEGHDDEWIGDDDAEKALRMIGIDIADFRTGKFDAASPDYHKLNPEYRGPCTGKFARWLPESVALNTRDD